MTARIRSPKSLTLSTIAFHLLALSIAFPTACIALTSLAFLAGGSLQPAFSLVALASCVGGAALARRSEISEVLVAGVIFCGLVILVSAISLGIVDVFYDSRVYHLPAVISLAQGWNPIWESNLCEWSKDFCFPTKGLIHHYPKAAWVMSATFYQWTGQLAAGKAYQLITLLASGLAVFRLLYSLGWFRPALSLALTLALALNPVSVKQVASFYVDGWLASSLLILFALLLDFVLLGRRSSLVLAAITLPFLINIKFTALPFAGILIVTSFVLAWRVRRPAMRPMLIWLGTAFSLAVFLTGFEPYVTNTFEEGNPFHPALKSDGSTVIDKQAAPSFMARDRVSKFAIANLSRGRREPGVPEWTPLLSSWRVTHHVGERFGGFGAPFGAALILALVGLAFVREPGAWIIGIGVLASIFVTEAAWWARLSPQAWWLPGLVATACLLPGSPRAGKVVGSLILAILLYTTAATLFTVAVEANTTRAPFENSLKMLDQHRGVIVLDQRTRHGKRAFALTFRQRLLDAGHDVPVVDEAPGRCISRYARAGAILCILR